ncbi:MAG: NAD(P)H-dependent oxidoreductase [Polyangiaceae bacterium]|nr:NAD(P)H-dependent oxidoreductase [Polyangiaceae bacterium]
MVLVLYAHPYADRSRANRALVRALDGLPGVEVRALYERYPDFSIDVAAEQAALARPRTIVVQHPLYWYAPPALLAMWCEKVLLHGWAFGEGGRALAGKRCLWAVTTGSPAEAYSAGGVHGATLEDLALPLRRTMALCGVEWLAPFVLHGARTQPRVELELAAARYRERLAALAARDARGGEAAP